MKAEARGTATATATSHLSHPNPVLFHSTPSISLSGAGLTHGALDGACVEKLLLHCAGALENNDVTLAQQVMWVLNNVASPHGDPNQRLTSWFLRALLYRASRLCPTTAAAAGIHSSHAARPKTVTELAGYIDLTPWHRFGFCSSNGAILSAVHGRDKIHILDFGITHCMQWPTLIDALAKRPEGAPSLRITVPSSRPPVPPSLTVSIEQVGLRLANFAKSRDVPFEFHVVDFAAGGGELAYQRLHVHPSSLGLRHNEAVVVNCQSWLRYLSDDPPPSSTSRDRFLEMIRGLNPCIVTVTDEDADLDSPSLSSRIMTCFNYLWIPFDALETFLSKDSHERMEYESDVGQKIENVVGFEGVQRIERMESGSRSAQRMRRLGFQGAAFGEETVREVRFLLDEHASGWGMKREEEMLVLTWKGHSSVYTAAWVPIGFDE